MSSDLMEDVECNGASVLLTMRANGSAELTVLEADLAEEEGSVAIFPLMPDERGLENAQKIITALAAWSEVVRHFGLAKGTTDLPSTSPVAS